MLCKRSLLALTVGFSLSLSACTGDQDSDFGVDADAPAKQPMYGGSGWNGGDPEIVGPCMDGIARVAYGKAGTNGNGWINPNLGYTSCIGGGADPSSYDENTDGAPYLNRPLTYKPSAHATNDVIENMVWSGVSENEVVLWSQGNQLEEFVGEGFLGTAWESQEIGTESAVSAFVAVNVAKLNAWPTSVEVYLEGDDIVLSESQGEFTVLESVIVANYEEVNGVLQGEILFFKADLDEEECADAETYYNQRTCHDGNGSCVPNMDVLPASAVSTYCLTGEKDQATSLLDPDLNCLGGRPVIRVWVRPGTLVDLAPLVCQSQ